MPIRSPASTLLPQQRIIPAFPPISDPYRTGVSPTFRPTACPRKLLPPLRKTGIRIERTCRSAPATLTFFTVRRRSGLPSYSVLPNDRSLFTTVQYRPAGHIRTRRDIMPRQNTPNDRITTKRNLKRIFQNMPKRHTDCFSLYLIQIYLNYHIYFIYFGIHKKKERRCIQKQTTNKITHTTHFY